MCSYASDHDSMVMVVAPVTMGMLIVILAVDMTAMVIGI